MNLSELLAIILSDIENTEIDILREILSLLPETSAAYLSDIFKHIIEYYDTHHEKPSTVYITQMFGTFFAPTVARVTPEVIKNLLYYLKEDVMINKGLLALQSRDLEKAREVINNSQVALEFTETKIGDVCDIYDKRSALPQGIPTGIAQLDAAYKGLSYKTNNFFAAPQKAGKTTAAISIAYEACQKLGLNVLYLTLEVSPEDILANMYARHSYELGTQLKAQEVKKNLLDDKGRALLQLVEEDFQDQLKKNGGHFSVVANHDLPEFNFTYIKQLLDAKTQEWGRIDFVVIDHIGLTGYYKIKGVSDMKERININIKWWTDMCKGYNEDGFILLTLMQINRQGTAMMAKGKSIDFSVLAEANEAEKSASTIAVMYSNPTMLMANNVKIYCLANRNGPPMIAEADDGSIQTYLNPVSFVLGHRKFGDTFSLKNKALLQNSATVSQEQEPEMSLLSSLTE